MTKLVLAGVSLATAVLAFGLAAPASAQLVCQKTAPSGKLTFKLRELCKIKEIEAGNLTTQPSGFLYSRTSATCLTDAPGVQAPVIPVFQLPNGGEWLIQAKADVVNLLPAAASDFFRCVLEINGQTADGSTVFLTSIGVGNLTLIGHAIGGSTVELSCQHDGTINNAGCPQGGAYVESAKLTATFLKTFSTIVVP